MKYSLAIAACAAEVFAYGVIGALIGWKDAGGVIPMLILLGTVSATWTAITGQKFSLPLSGRGSRERIASTPSPRVDRQHAQCQDPAKSSDDRRPERPPDTSGAS